MADGYYSVLTRLCDTVGKLIEVEKERNEIEKERNNTLALIKQYISDLTAIQTKYSFGSCLREVDSESNAGLEILEPRIARTADGNPYLTKREINYYYYNERKHNKNDDKQNNLDESSEYFKEP